MKYKTVPFSEDCLKANILCHCMCFMYQKKKINYPIVFVTLFYYISWMPQNLCFYSNAFGISWELPCAGKAADKYGPKWLATVTLVCVAFE